MSWSIRGAFVVLLTLTLIASSALWLEPAQAQLRVIRGKQLAAPMQQALPAQPPNSTSDPGVDPDGFLYGGITLPKDEHGRKKAIEAAVDYINDGNWAIAINRLQKLLEIKEDVFVRLTRKKPGGKEVLAWVSVKQEADRLIGTLPSAGLDFYKLTFGAKAADLLKKAKQSGDPGLLAELMKRYAHTDAGGEAIKILADYHLDRGNYIAAVLCYDKLLNREGADKLPPSVLFKAAYAAHMAPASATLAQDTQISTSRINEKGLWKQLHNQGREVQLGNETRLVSDLEEYVAKLERPNFSQDATDSVVFRATPSRSNQLVGGPAFMTPIWRKDVLYYKDDEAPAVYQKLQRAEELLKGRNQPILPAFSPITVTVTKGDQKEPLLIYKTMWGITARRLKDGEPAWDSPSQWSLERMLYNKAEARKSQAMNNWLQFYLDQGQQPEILFENSTVGTLSTDGKYVYVVEDLAIPPPPTMNPNFNAGMENNGYSTEIQDAINHSRLQAFDLKTAGKLTWELGGEEKGPLSDCYFLGPPLPLGGKLYVLTEKQQELRLVCLDPDAKGAIVSTQMLGMTEEKMRNDVMRRINAAHLAYGEGILVCPTNAGAIFGINLLENSLVWAYPYRAKGDAIPQAAGGGRFRGGALPPGWVWGPNGQPIQTSPQNNHWKASAPVIADGKVIFTAPDARSIHCINLRDGSPVWYKPKQEDDLYLGNVYNGKVLIVGKKSVRGLSLATGETLWTIETGMPSGQGIGSDNIYYLPLREAGRDKRPQICAIDMDKGTIFPNSPQRRQTVNGTDVDVPGNLLFYEGDVISLNHREVVVYPQLKLKIAQMDELIAKNPNDPRGLTERGELRLGKNDLPGAIDDLSAALKNNPDKATRARARGKLYDTLTAYISEHFNDAEKYLPEYEELCTVEMEGASGKELEDLQAEHRRRRATFLWLVGKGREEQGRLVEAFEKYSQFGAVAGKNQELVPAVDERQVKAAPDVWSRGRIIAMMAKAKPEHREPLEKLIASKWEKLQTTNDLNELRQFVRMFAPVSTAGKEARLQLVERLMEQKDSSEEHPLLEAELELSQFRTGQQSLELAARATEALARLYTRKGLLEDAAYCYRKLGGEFAKVLIRNGKTGRQIYDDDAATDKRLLPYLDEPDPFGAVKLKAKPVRDNFPMPGNGQLFQFQHSGEALPFFRRHTVGLNFGDHHFKLIDRNSGEEVWSTKLTQTMFQMLTNQVLNQFIQFNNFNNPNLPWHQPRFSYRTLGHLVVLPAGPMVYGIDPVNRHVLWEKNLAAGSSGPGAANPSQPNGPPWQQPLVDPRDGSVLVVYTDGWAQRLGTTGPLEGQTICVQIRDNLTALDPLTGRILWSRSDITSRNRFIFADEEHIFVVEMDNDNNPHASRVFRATDGISVKAPDFSALFKKRLQVFGRHLLLSEPGAANTITLRLYDPLTGQDVWKHAYPSHSLVARSEDPRFTGVVEPDGNVHVVDLKARKEVMTSKMAEPAKELLNVQAIHLLADGKNFYLTCQAPMEVNNFNGAGLQSNVNIQLGMRTVPVNGMIYAFNRGSGEVEWYVHAKNQMLLLDQFEELPVVLLTARRQELQNRGVGGQQVVQVVSAMSIEKRSGRVIFGDENLQNTTNFWGVRIDARAGTIDFLSPNLKITHFSEATDAGKAAKPDDKRATEKTSSTTPQPVGESLKRTTIDRVRIREIANPLPPE